MRRPLRGESTSRLTAGLDRLAISRQSRAIDGVPAWRNTKRRQKQGPRPQTQCSALLTVPTQRRDTGYVNSPRW